MSVSLSAHMPTLARVVTRPYKGTHSPSSSGSRFCFLLLTELCRFLLLRVSSRLVSALLCSRLVSALVYMLLVSLLNSSSLCSACLPLTFRARLQQKYLILLICCSVAVLAIDF